MATSYLEQGMQAKKCHTQPFASQAETAPSVRALLVLSSKAANYAGRLPPLEASATPPPTSTRATTVGGSSDSPRRYEDPAAASAGTTAAESDAGTAPSRRTAPMYAHTPTRPASRPCQTNWSSRSFTGAVHSRGAPASPTSTRIASAEQKLVTAAPCTGVRPLFLNATVWIDQASAAARKRRSPSSEVPEAGEAVRIPAAATQQHRPNAITPPTRSRSTAWLMAAVNRGIPTARKMPMWAAGA